MMYLSMAKTHKLFLRNIQSQMFERVLHKPMKRATLHTFSSTKVAYDDNGLTLAYPKPGQL